MSESRNIRWDILALAMGAVSIVLWLSLITHDAADPVSELAWPFRLLYTPDQVAYPLNGEIQNQCGYWGVLVSHILLHAFGIGAYLVAGLSSLSVVVMLRQKPLASPLGRSVGWTLVLAAIATFPHVTGWHFNIPVAVGSGGYLGATIGLWIDKYFAFAGGLILTLSCLLAGLLLSTEYAVLRFLRILAIGPTATVIRNTSTRFRGLPATSSAANHNEELVTDESDDAAYEYAAESETDEEDGPKIRIPQKDNTNVGGDESGYEQHETEVTGDLAKASVATAAAGLAGRTLRGAFDGIGGIGKSLMHGLRTSSKQRSVRSDVDSMPDQLASHGAVEIPSRELEIAGQQVAARMDRPHGASEEPAEQEPTAKSRNTKLNAAKRPPPKIKRQESAEDERSSLDFLDDTRLPEGTEEYVLPGLDLLDESTEVDYEAQAIEVRRKAKVLEQTFQNFGLNVKVVEIETGPVIAQYEIELEAGLRLSKITGLADDVAIALRVPSVRIVAPIPGKNSVGIEVPNETREMVRMRDVIEQNGAAQNKKMKIPLFVGKDVSGNALTVDLASLPHLLIAGRTGTGKSVCLNSIISSILMTRRPDEVRMLMIDPKMVELTPYGRLPHLMHPVVTDMRKAEAILAWAVDKMEERYQLLARVGVRHITSYNQLGREELLERLQASTPEEEEAFPDYLPFIVIVADEIADMMMTAGKEVEQHIIRLAQKSRAVGIHLILATQKPTVDVITGLIKSNLPARISFQVASRTDSRVVLDEMGADKLLGNGDMLFLGAGTSMLLRGQGTYLSDDEINRVVDHCSTGEQNFVNELVNLEVKQDDEVEAVARPGMLKKRDELYESAIDVVVSEGRGSCSLLQRALGIGYGRAARMIDWMAEDNIVGEYNGPQAREVVISQSDWELMKSGGDPSSEEASAPPPKSNKIRMNATAVEPAMSGTWDEEEEEEIDEEYEIDEAIEEDEQILDDEADVADSHEADDYEKVYTEELEEAGSDEYAEYEDDEYGEVDEEEYEDAE